MVKLILVTNNYKNESKCQDDKNKIQDYYNNIKKIMKILKFIYGIKITYRKDDLLYIFFNLEYKEIYSRKLDFIEAKIITEHDYIYINDKHSLYVMNIKNKEVIIIFEIESLGPILPIN